MDESVQRMNEWVPLLLALPLPLPLPLPLSSFFSAACLLKSSKIGVPCGIECRVGLLGSLSWPATARGQQTCCEGKETWGSWQGLFLVFYEVLSFYGLGLFGAAARSSVNNPWVVVFDRGTMSRLRLSGAKKIQCVASSFQEIPPSFDPYQTFSPSVSAFTFLLYLLVSDYSMCKLLCFTDG